MNKYFKKPFFLLSLLLLCRQSGVAQWHLPCFISDGMIIQRDTPCTIWGWAAKGETITIQFAGKTQQLKADKATGKWNCMLPAVSAGKQYSIEIIGKSGKSSIKQVTPGEVWLASGQSNMEYKMSWFGSHFSREMRKADLPDIKYYEVKNTVSLHAKDTITGYGWQSVTPESIKSMSAVAYFFAKELHQKLNVPIGIMQCEWGGTPAEAWTSKEALHKMKDFDEAIAKLLNTKSLEEANNPQSSGIEKYYAIANTLDEGRKFQGKEWYLPETNTADWLPYKVPDAWEKSALPDFDGIAWARLDVELTAAWTNTNIKLSLGKIDDDDSVWVNGVKIGGTRGWNRLREYTIPGNLIRSGKNTIVVRINDTGGDGGIYGDEDDLYLEQGRNYFNLSGNWLLKPGVAQNALPASIGDLRLQNQPTTLFNAMLHPLIPYTIKGVIWYQGETNAPRAHQYQTLFPLMITDWRKRWNQGDFPFLFVQLANYRQADTIPSESDWAELREAQFMALSLPNTGCATAIDIGEANDIHPKNKQEVGRRLALQAFKLAYGQIIQADGPILEKVTQEGNKIRVSFTSVGSELMVKDKYGYVKGFAVAGKDGKFHYAKGTISSNNEITLESAMVPAPLYVRYGWATNPDDINLYNKDGLPAFPFRTDNFKGITEGKK